MNRLEVSESHFFHCPIELVQEPLHVRGKRVGEGFEELSVYRGMHADDTEAESLARDRALA
jgi:hypothetical protein